MKATPIWVAATVVEAVHLQQLAEHGGAAGIRDAGLLASALARPQQLFAYGGASVTYAQLAAAYAFGLARNHPFGDGKKRAAVVISLLFLALNGYDLAAPMDNRYLTFMALAEGSLSEQALADWFAEHLIAAESAAT